MQWHVSLSVTLSVPISYHTPSSLLHPPTLLLLLPHPSLWYPYPVMYYYYGIRCVIRYWNVVSMSCAQFWVWMYPDSSLFIWTQRTEGIGFQIISLRNYMSPWPAPRRASSYLGLRLQTALSLGMELNKIIIRLCQFIFNGNFRAGFHLLHTINRNYL